MKDIAVLMATYNGGQYIRQQLDSLFSQTRQNFRLVIHDDGSTDDTIQVLNEYKGKYPDRIEILPGQPTGGAKTNFIYLLKEVEADYYLLCDQDDVWLQDKIEKSMDALLEMEQANNPKSEKPAIVFTDMYVVSHDLTKIDDSFIRYIGRDINNVCYTQILIDNPAAGTTMCFNRSLRNIAVSSNAICWDNVPMHDSWLLEIGALYGMVKGLNIPLVYYRQTGSNIMGAVTESVSSKVQRNARDVACGFLEKKRAFINEARLFAAEILKLSDIPQDKERILKEFVSIGSKSKLIRQKFYKDNNFTRAHHNFWMRLWV